MKSNQFAESFVREALFTKHIEVPRYGVERCVDMGWAHYLNLADMPIEVIEQVLQSNLDEDKALILFQSKDPAFISSILLQLDTLTALEIEDLVVDSGVKLFFISETHESCI